MAHESFEDEDIARVMNEFFVNIKVDREERPDLDQIYQNVAQIFTRGGGWPLTVFLTPDLKPFYGGTYFPPDDRYGRPGFKRVLTALAENYRDNAATVVANADKLVEMIAKAESMGAYVPGQVAEPGAVTLEALKKQADALLGGVDYTNGGIGHAPKFPNPMTFSFLWRMGEVCECSDYREAVTLTLRKMALGGIYDHLGGGFSRYSVDESWAVPHFEKMLYDNGLLLKLYSEVLLSEMPLSESDRELFTRVVRETVDYVLREMTSQGGGFYAAQDADSEGEEGKFFAWNPSEVRAVLSADEAEAFCRKYGVTETGNFEHGKTVLAVQATLDAHGEVRAEAARKKLFAAREKRVKPGLDDKILTAWNGLMISGLCWAARVLSDERPRAAARRAFAFVRERAGGPGNRLMSTVQAGKGRFNGYLDDYAFMSMAALDLAGFSTDDKEISDAWSAAEGWMGVVLKHFRDDAGAGYFFTSDDHEALLQRPKTLHDQAIPSGTAVVLQCLEILAEATGEQRWEDESARQFNALSGAALKSPFGMTELLLAALLRLQGPVLVSGVNAEKEIRGPHFYQKAGRAQPLQWCHKRVCHQGAFKPSR
jgi:uncharacterized protein YyaL (SSP411 family)